MVDFAGIMGNVGSEVVSMLTGSMAPVTIVLIALKSLSIIRRVIGWMDVGSRLDLGSSYESNRY